jgi:cytochrome c553
MMFLLGTVSHVAVASERSAEVFSTQCAACHGNAGIETDAPILYGQEPACIVKSPVAFKHGHRKDRIMMVMNTIAAALSDDDLREVAGFVAGRDACQVGLKIDHRREGFRAAFVAGRQK